MDFRVLGGILIYGLEQMVDVHPTMMTLDGCQSQVTLLLDIVDRIDPFFQPVCSIRASINDRRMQLGDQNATNWQPVYNRRLTNNKETTNNWWENIRRPDWNLSLGRPLQLEAVSPTACHPAPVDHWKVGRNWRVLSPAVIMPSWHGLCNINEWWT